MLRLADGRLRYLPPGASGPVTGPPDDPGPLAVAAEERAWLAAGTVPGATVAEREAAARSLLFLRLLVRPGGAALAAQTPYWAYVWPRDAGFAAAALAVTGHRREAGAPSSASWPAPSATTAPGRPAPTPTAGRSTTAARPSWTPPAGSRGRPGWPPTRAATGGWRPGCGRWCGPPPTTPPPPSAPTACPRPARLLGAARAPHPRHRRRPPGRPARRHPPGRAGGGGAPGRLGAGRGPAAPGVAAWFGPGGYQRHPSGGGPDAAVTWLGPPFGPPDPAVARAVRAAWRRLTVAGGAVPGRPWLGATPGPRRRRRSPWPPWPATWRPPSPAGLAARPPDGAGRLPGAGRARRRRPRSVAPLAWTHALVLLTLVSRDRAVPTPDLRDGGRAGAGAGAGPAPAAVSWASRRSLRHVERRRRPGWP